MLATNILLIYNLLLNNNLDYYLTINYKLIICSLQACSSVDRASDSDSESRGFDSLHAYSFITKIIKTFYFHKINV